MGEIWAQAGELGKTVFERFGEFGPVGLLMAVIAWFAYVLLTRTLDAREKDLAWHRSELLAKRQEFTEALKSQQAAFTQALEHVEVRWQRVIDSLVARLDQISHDLTALVGEED